MNARRLTFVTGNDGKRRELAAMLAPLGIEVEASDVGYPEIQADTLAEVAQAGAQHLLDAGVKPPFILEDAGLFVAALKGFPGVYSRYALDTVGLEGMLALMRNVEQEVRSAAFVSHLLLVDAAGAMHSFEGTCRGRLAERIAGRGGFGFDPIFVPENHDTTFGQMDPAQKNQISHRGRAVAALIARLEDDPGLLLETANA